MSHKKTRWSKVYESSEEELVAFLRSRGRASSRIVGEESSILLGQIADAPFTLWCAEGSLKVSQGAINASIQPGDAMTMEAAIPYDLRAGITGYVCYVTD